MSRAERYPFGAPGEEWSNWSARRRRSPRKFDVEVRPRLRELWDAGDPLSKDNILAYLSSATPEEGWDLVWEALNSEPADLLPDEQRWALQGTAVIAAMRYVSRGHAVPDEQVERLRRCCLHRVRTRREA